MNNKKAKILLKTTNTKRVSVYPNGTVMIDYGYGWQFTPSSFGAVCNGVTDDTQAIQMFFNQKR